MRLPAGLCPDPEPAEEAYNAPKTPACVKGKDTKEGEGIGEKKWVGKGTGV